MRCLFLVSLAIVFTTPIALAQSTSEHKTEFEEIVVTATRVATPLADTLPSTQIITSEDIERLKPRGLGDLLSRKSGLVSSASGGRGSVGSIFVRGTNSNQVIFLIDGMRTASVTLGGTAIQRIPLESIERIEIVKGPMSSVYGSDAIGGVIQIFTKQYDDVGSFASVRTSAGSNSFRHYVARAGYGDDGYNILVSLSKESTKGIDATEFEEGGNDDRDGFKQSVSNFAFVANPSDSTEVKLNHVQSSGRVEYDNVGTFGSSSRKNVGEDWHSQTKLSATSVRFKYEHSENFAISGMLGRAQDYYRDIKLDHPFASSRVTYFKTKKTDYSIHARYDFSSQNRMSFGVDYQKDGVDSTTDYEVKKRNTKGIFALWEHKAEKASTIINARYDKFGVYGSDSNFSIQQSYNVSDCYQFVASYGTAFKAPTFNDLYWPNSGNPDLDPEKSKSIELSLRAKKDDWFWQINTYRTKVRDLIAWAPTADNPSVWKPSNVNQATMRGVEFDLTREWNGNIFNASIGYLDAEDKKTGRFLENRARVSASIEFGKHIGDLYIGGDAYIEHARFNRQQQLPGYALWGINGRYELSDSISISGRIKNLFDKQYVTNRASTDNAYQTEGRTLQFTFQYDF